MPPLPRAAVIVNPISGAGHRGDAARRRAEHAAALVTAHRLDADVFVTERQGHARELTRVALQRGARLVVAWGGDGTVNEVASALVESTAALAIVPSGSGNGLARELGIARAPDEAFAVAVSGRPRLIDAGELDGRLFFNLAGFGLDARVAHAFAAGGLARRGFVRYLELAAWEVFRYEPGEYTVTTNGLSVPARPLLVAIANSCQYGNGALIAPAARLDDGRLDVVIVDHRSPWQVLRQVRHLFAGTIAQVPGVHATTVTEVDVASSARLVYHLDGEPYTGGTVAHARVRPQVLRVMVPIANGLRK